MMLHISTINLKLERLIQSKTCHTTYGRNSAKPVIACLIPPIESALHSSRCQEWPSLQAHLAPHRICGVLL